MYISNGNLRMKIPTFSLPAVLTCDGSTSLCRKYCYAKKAEYKLNPRRSRRQNLIDSNNKLFTFDMSGLIKRKKSKYIRIHEAGDFYSQEYLRKWFIICRRIPDKKFLVYTQMYDLDWSEKPDNMIVYWSIWPDTDMSKVPKEGLRAYVEDDGTGKIPSYKNKLTCKQCTKGKDSDLTCDKCLWCYEGKGNIRFHLH